MISKDSNNNTKKAVCSFCGRKAESEDTFIEGPNGVFICPECVDLCYNIVRQNQKQKRRTRFGLSKIPSPRTIRELLDEYVIVRNTPRNTCR